MEQYFLRHAYRNVNTTYPRTATAHNLASSSASSYQEVEYIQCDGNQKIRSGLTFDLTKNYVFEGKCNTGTQRTEMCVFGSDTGSTFEIGYSSTNNRFFLYSTASAGYNSTESIYDRDIEFVGKINAASPYKELIIYDIDGGDVYDSSTVNNDCAGEILLFGGYKGYAGKLYYAKITIDGILVRDFIPCIRLSDNEVGMYDSVSRTFFGNSGTGTFIPGNPI